MEETPHPFRLTPISYVVLIILAVVWPATSFYFLSSQLELAKDITDPLREIYYPTMVIQLATLLLVLFAVRSEQVTLADIGLTRFTRWTVLQAAAFFVAANAALSILQLAISVQAPESFAEITSLLPKTLYEKIVWVILCIIVAVSEELIFRGYIITRVAQLTGGRIWIGVLVATLSFASGHLYEGLGGFALIFIYGLMFAGLFLYARSLYACIIAHFMQDAIVLAFPSLK